MSQKILAISGNDVFSGGGLYADLTTYTLNGLRGFLAVTCLTAMTEQGFQVFATDTKVFQAQLASLQKVDFAGVKLGLLPNVEVAEAALNFVRSHKDLPIVLDPVLVCKEKHDVAVSALRDELLQFLPYMSILTPNLAEAEILTGLSIKNLEDMKQAAQKLQAMGAKAVVVKGGNRLDSDQALDVYCDEKGLEVLSGPLSDKNNVGAGCTFASSIASQLVLGKEPLEAVKLAKEFVYQAILHSDDYGVVQAYDK